MPYGSATGELGSHAGGLAGPAVRSRRSLAAWARAGLRKSSTLLKYCGSIDVTVSSRISLSRERRFFFSYAHCWEGLRPGLSPQTSSPRAERRRTGLSPASSSSSGPTHKSSSRVRFRANRTLSQLRRMTESGPDSDIGPIDNFPNLLLNDCIGPDQNGLGDSQPYLLGGLQIDHKNESIALLNRQVRRI